MTLLLFWLGVAWLLPAFSGGRGIEKEEGEEAGIFAFYGAPTFFVLFCLSLSLHLHSQNPTTLWKLCIFSRVWNRDIISAAAETVRTTIYFSPFSWRERERDLANDTAPMFCNDRSSRQ